MSKKYPRAKWTLPLIVDPQAYICYTIRVPDEVYYNAAFLGALATLGSAASWADDPQHKAIAVAQVWRTIADNLKFQPCDVERQLIGGVLEDCGMRLRISPDNSCIIQCFDECAQTWGDWFDVSQCAPGAVVQPPPGGTPDVGSTTCYDVVLPGNSQWISPIPIQEGDEITISQESGGWSDGAGWYCPNGQSYALGLCTGAGATSGTDPAPAVLHGRLVASLDGGASWQDGYNATINIPIGETSNNLLLQMNDVSLGDNYGSITLKVCIDHAGVATWDHQFDFTAGQQGFVAVVAPSDSQGRAIYVTSSGWIDVYGFGGGTNTELRIVWGIPVAPTILTEVSLHYDADVAPTTLKFDIAGTGVNLTPLSTGSNIAATTGIINYTTTGIRLDMNKDSVHANFRVTNIRLKGRGPDPFA